MGDDDRSQADSGLGLSGKSVSELVDSILNGQTTIASLVDALLNGLFSSGQWKRYSGQIDLSHESEITYHYDKRFRLPTLPDSLKDPFVKIMLEHGYFVHEFAANVSHAHSLQTKASEAVTAVPLQTAASSKPFAFDVYVMGYTSPQYEGAGYIADLFRKLAGLDRQRKREKQSILDKHVSIAAETVVGEVNMWQVGQTFSPTVQEIRDYCVRAGSTILEGYENHDANNMINNLLAVALEIKKRIKDTEAKAATEKVDDINLEQMRSKNRQAREAILRLGYERARNTYMPLLERFLSTKRLGERRICIYSPELLRNPAFMGGYRPEVFGETNETYYGGLRELAKKYQVNYITFMRPAAQLRMV